MSDYNLTNYFLNSAASHRLAVIADGRKLTYGQLRAHVCLARREFEVRNLTAGDRVLICLPDGEGFLAAWFAAQSLGLVTVEVATDIPTLELGEMIEYVEPDLIVTDRLDFPQEPWPVMGPDEVATGLPSVRAVPCVPVADGQVTIWKFTSGSTGRPKACQLPARAAIHVYEGLEAAGYGLTRHDVVLPVPNLHFGYARDLAALFPFRVGATSIIYSHKCTRPQLDELMVEHRPTVLVNVPVMMAKVLAESVPDLYRGLRLNFSAGDHLPVRLNHDWRESTGVPTVNILGASEAYHAYLVQAEGRCVTGFEPLPGTTIRLVHSSGRDAGPGEHGRIEVTSPAVAHGYWDVPASVNADFTAPGVWESRDLGTLEADGSITYLGRLGRMTKVNGRWVNPVEVEKILHSDPLVHAAAVFPTQSDNQTSRLIAAVVADQAFNCETAQRAIEDQLGRMHVPAQFQFLTELPEQLNGKVDYSTLTARLTA